MTIDNNISLYAEALFLTTKNSWAWIGANRGFADNLATNLLNHIPTHPQKDFQQPLGCLISCSFLKIGVVICFLQESVHFLALTRYASHLSFVHKLFTNFEFWHFKLWNWMIWIGFAYLNCGVACLVSLSTFHASSGCTFCSAKSPHRQIVLVQKGCDKEYRNSKWPQNLTKFLRAQGGLTCCQPQQRVDPGRTKKQIWERRV